MTQVGSNPGVSSPCHVAGDVGDVAEGVSLAVVDDLDWLCDFDFHRWRLAGRQAGDGGVGGAKAKARPYLAAMRAPPALTRTAAPQVTAARAARAVSASSV
ncbi:MAG: hypothetical protein WBZ37_25985, partial [Mycobacterium sp.]